MNKQQAHAILDQIQSGTPMSLFVTNQALYATGDISGLFGEPLRFDGDEQGNNRPCEAHEQIAEIGFSYSKYLDCPTTESAT
jgi:hypothetical protein